MAAGIRECPRRGKALKAHVLAIILQEPNEAHADDAGHQNDGNTLLPDLISIIEIIFHVENKFEFSTWKTIIYHMEKQGFPRGKRTIYLLYNIK